jgi:hypothetical protein
VWDRRTRRVWRRQEDEELDGVGQEQHKDLEGVGQEHHEDLDGSG